jgi:hypothetical protein
MAHRPTHRAASKTTSQQTAHVNGENLELVNHHCYSRRVLFQNVLNRFSLPLYKVFHLTSPISAKYLKRCYSPLWEAFVVSQRKQTVLKIDF